MGEQQGPRRAETVLNFRALPQVSVRPSSSVLESQSTVSVPCTGRTANKKSPQRELHLKCACCTFPLISGRPSRIADDSIHFPAINRPAACESDRSSQASAGLGNGRFR